MWLHLLLLLPPSPLVPKTPLQWIAIRVITAVDTCQSTCLAYYSWPVAAACLSGAQIMLVLIAAVVVAATAVLAVAPKPMERVVQLSIAHGVQIPWSNSQSLRDSFLRCRSCWPQLSCRPPSTRCNDLRDCQGLVCLKKGNLYVIHLLLVSISLSLTYRRSIVLIRRRDDHESEPFILVPAHNHIVREPEVMHQLSKLHVISSIAIDHHPAPKDHCHSSPGSCLAH